MDYGLRVAEYGEKSEIHIRAGMNNAVELLKANRGDEAIELLTKNY